MFKDKKFARRLALVLCLSLVVGILPVGVLNAPVQINAVSDNLIVDGSFEEGKWNTGTALFLVDDAATGAKSMQMNAGKGGVGTTQQIDAAISAFEVYELSFMYKHAIGRAPYIGVWFFKDEANNDHFVDASVIYPADQSGEWVKVTLEVVVPEGANIAQLQIGYNSDGKSEDPTSACQIDDLSLVMVRKYAFVEKFEDLKVMASKGWTASNNFSGSAVYNYANYYQGTKSLFLQAGGAWTKSPAFAVEAGNTYTAEFYAMKSSTKSDRSDGVQLVFLDKNGAELDKVEMTLSIVNNEWKKQTLTGIAPAGAVSAQLVYTLGSASGDYGIDDLYVAEIAASNPDETKPSEPETVPSEPATEPAEESVVVFSENVEASNFKQTWTLTKTAMPWGDKDYKYEGSRVLLIQGANDTATSPKFAVAAGKTYTLSYFAKQHTAPAGAADAGSAQIQFLDANGAVIEAAKAPACAVADWTEKTISAVAPAGAVNAQLFFDSGDSKLIYVVDAMVVTETGKAAPEETVPSEPETVPSEPETVPSEPAGNLVFSDKFEEHDKYDYTNTQGKPSTNAIPKGWTSYDPHNIRAACNKNYFDVYEGYNLFFQEAKGDKWVKSPLFDVVAGNTYTANFMDIKMPGTVGTGAYAAIVFVDANGAVLATQTAAAGLANTWGANSVVATAPSGAVAAYVEFGLKSATGNPEFAVDNLEVYMTEGTAPEVTEPSTEATEPSTEATEPSEPAFDGVIPNGGFEDGKNGWLGGAAVEISDSDVYAGNYAALIPASEAAVFMKSEKIPAVPGQTYYLSVMAKRLSGDKQAYIGFWYVDANGAYVGDGATSIRFADDAWTEYTMEWTVPEGVAYFWVEWGVNSKANTSFVIDNIVVTDAPYVPEGPTEPSVTEPSEPATEPTEAPIFTDTFENAYTPDGAAKTVHVPVGWTPSVLSAAIGTAGYDKYDGTNNLCVQDPKNKDIKSPLIEVIPGYEYAAKYVEKKYQPNVAGDGGYVKIVFVDATGAILKEYSQIAGQSAEWTNKTLLSKAPAGATHMYVEFGLLNPTGEPTYSVDNLAVYAYEAELGDAEPTMPTEPIPTEPEGTNVMFGDKFETLADATTGNAGPLGWISSDDTNGAYSAAISVGTFGIENDGNFLCLQTPGQWSIRSSKFAAKAGYEYEIKFLARKLVDNANYTGALKIVFLDAYGNVTGDFTETVGKTFGAWTAESVKAAAPNGTVAAYLEFSLDNADRKTKGDYGIDDLEVIKSDEPVFVPEEPTEPSNPSEPGEGNTGTGDSVVLLPVFGVMAAVVALAVLVIKKRRFF